MPLTPIGHPEVCLISVFKARAAREFYNFIDFGHAMLNDGTKRLVNYHAITMPLRCCRLSIMAVRSAV